MVIVLEDRTISRTALHQILVGSHGDDLTETADPQVADELCEKTGRGVLIMPYVLSKASSIEFAQTIVKRSPNISILLISMPELWIPVLTAAKAGVRGLLLESDPAELIVEAVTALTADLAYLSPG